LTDLILGTRFVLYQIHFAFIFGLFDRRMLQNVVILTNGLQQYSLVRLVVLRKGPIANMENVDLSNCSDVSQQLPTTLGFGRHALPYSYQARCGDVVRLVSSEVGQCRDRRSSSTDSPSGIFRWLATAPCLLSSPGTVLTDF
jgi:hypothetical protein